jgi:hypothetical protein
MKTTRKATKGTTGAPTEVALGTAPATEAQSAPDAGAPAKSPRSAAAATTRKQAKAIAEKAAAKKDVARFKQYVAYALKPANRARPESLAKYQKGLADAQARLAAVEATLAETSRVAAG